jgi:hypothetical protein
MQSEKYRHLNDYKLIAMPNNIQVHIAEPCHENWNNMSKAEQGRFCQSCQKTVTDFTLMSDREILAQLSGKSDSTCGRFTNDQLNRALQIEHSPKRSWAYFWNMAIATVLTTGSGYAQTNKGYTQGDTVMIAPPVPISLAHLSIIKGKVVDAKTNQPVPYASVYIKGTQSGTVTDSTGRFKLRVQYDNAPLVVQVSYIGYEVAEFLYTGSANEVTYYLEASKSELLGEVVVCARPAPPTAITQGLTAVVMGGIGMKIDVPSTEKVLRRIVDWTHDYAKKKPIKVFPNPVSPGKDINVSFNIPESGKYSLDIIDNDGKIIYRESIAVQTKDQSSSVPTSASWSRGIYWVRVSDPRTKKVYNAKLVVQ